MGLGQFRVFRAQKEMGCPFLIDGRINITEPICLPCSLLCFISSPTVYGKQKPAAKRVLGNVKISALFRGGAPKFLNYRTTYYASQMISLTHIQYPEIMSRPP